MAAPLQVGDCVVITATDERYAFVDGWIGHIASLDRGAPEVRCTTHDRTLGRAIEKTFFVPADQLRVTVRLAIRPMAQSLGL